MKPQTSLPETTTDYVGVYKTLLDNSSENMRAWTTSSNLTDKNLFKIEFDEASSSDFPGIRNKNAETPPIFSEMEILYKNEKQLEWRETARWIKFEEKVEDGGNRWSKPYVGTLLLKSLTLMKQLLLNGNFMPDVEAQSVDALTKIIVENLVNSGTILLDERDDLKMILLSPHRHQYQLHTSSKSKVDQQRTKISNEEQNLNTKHKNKRFLRKIPAGAETCNIMVGALESLKKTLTIFVRMKEATIFNQLTEVPVPTRFIFILLGPNERGFHEVGRAMGTLMCDDVFRKYAYFASEMGQLKTGINNFMDTTLLIPPAEWNNSIRIEPPASTTATEIKKQAPDMPDKNLQNFIEDNEEQQRIDSGLVRTGCLFGGLINDIKRKSPWYWSDFMDAINMQCVASWIFLYFACLSPIVTFGGLLSVATGKNIAAIESLVSGFICGIGYGLFSGQPLAILGSTGPLLVFESIVYKYCEGQGWDYLTFRFWVGTWIALILLLLTAFDASAAVCYITRFTEENFATLISFIFIYEAIHNVISLSEKYPINNSNSHCFCMPPNVENETILEFAKFNQSHCLVNNGTLIGSDCLKPETVNVFLMSVILFLGTFLISITLKNFKNAFFFPTFVRQFISDFAVIIAIFSMTSFDFFLQVATQKLEVPTDLKPTLSTRGWLIPALHEQNPTWTIFAAIIPALLGTILIFMDQQITAVIINRKENQLKKGCGYHLDLFILSLLIQICSVMGLPWFVAATVLSLNHVNSLKKETESSAPGEKPQFLGIREQRVTQILIFVTIGFSVTLAPLLRHIPMAVLFGVFLYMGVASLKGLQFYERILIIFMPAKYQPDQDYLRQVPIKRVHLFTAIQLACLITLWLIKSYPQVSILFPLMLVVMIGIRKLLDYVFTQRELKILDDLLPGMSKSETPQEGNLNKGFENCA